MVKDRDRPHDPRRRAQGKWIALALAVLVNLAFVGVLVFSVTWRNPPAPAVSAELYAPPVRAPAPPKPEPPRPEPPKPEPKPEPPKPEPKPEPPKPEPPPDPPKPPPPVEKPDPREAEIALKAKQDDERKRREQVERTRAEAEKRKREAEEKQRAEEKQKAEDKQKAEEKQKADARERQQRATEALRDQAEREARSRAEAEAKVRAEAEAKVRAASEAKARAAAETQARVQAENAARSRAEGDWIRRIQAKVRGNVILPPDLPGNPEAIFEVVQLPTGEILDVQLRKSSGVRGYDDAVQRAILKSSPLPRPDRADLFQRTLTLKFRPVD